jgi:hypothetical protein
MATKKKRPAQAEAASANLFAEEDAKQKEEEARQRSEVFARVKRHIQAVQESITALVELVDMIEVPESHRKKLDENGEPIFAKPFRHLIPEGFFLKKSFIDYAMRVGFTRQETEEEFSRMVSHYKEKGERMANWDMVAQRWFRTGMSWKKEREKGKTPGGQKTSKSLPIWNKQ